MNWLDIVAMADTQVFALLGEIDITFTSKATRTPVPTKALQRLDNPLDLTPTGGAEAVHILVRGLASPPVTGDGVDIGTFSYTVQRVDPDLAGGYLLKLRAC